MSNAKELFHERLKKVLKLKNITQQELSEKTGINKGNISGYMNMKYEPKLDTVAIIADALKINPVWLIGYDVPMDPVDETLQVEKEEPELTVLQKVILDYLKDLNDEQLYQVITFLKSLT